MKTISTILLVLFTLTSFSQEKKKDSKNKKPIVQIYGFVRSEFYYDSYKGLNAAMDNFYLVPLYKGKDANDHHINQQGIANYTAMATRFGMKIKGPELLGAKSSAAFETDFAGIVTEYPEVLRLRKAFVKLDWEKSSLLIGQTWHPLWNGSGAFFPRVGGLNTGSPYNPFSRSPQIDFDYRMGKVTLSATALYENHYCSKGFYPVPNTNSKNLAKRNAVIPEMVLGLYYTAKSFTTGIAGQFNAVKPIDVTQNPITGDKYVTDELNKSFVGMAFLGYKKDKLYILAKGLVGQNMVNLTMFGGYGVKDFNTTTGAMTYTNYNNYSALFNIVYGKKVQIGLFTGISGNMGTSDPLYRFDDGKPKIAGMLTSIKNTYRVSPHLTYNIKNMSFIAEYEMTTAEYGSGTFNYNDGLYSDKVSVTNNRILLVLMYNF
jgi:hypothetical protein